MITEAARQGADILVRECGRLCAGERVVIVCDSGTRAVAALVEARARLLTADVRLVEIPPLRMHGEEPLPAAAEAMAEADLCMGITSKSMAHTRARRAAAEKGARYLSLPDYSIALVADPALRVDFALQGRLARRVADLFTAGHRVRVTSPAGTDLTLAIGGRTGNCCPGYVTGPGELGSPPDIEANVSPVETSAEGVVVVDGSIPYPGFGLLKAPVRVEVRGGRITGFQGDRAIVARLGALFESAGSPKACVLAECGVGLNDRATLTGVMLTDEGAAGTMHFGFGSNATVGGCNDVPFHLDMVFRDPSLDVDGLAVLDGGRYCVPAEAEDAPGRPA